MSGPKGALVSVSSPAPRLLPQKRKDKTMRLAWSLLDISKQTGLSVSFLRKEVRDGRLPIKRFGRRVLVLDADLKTYLGQENVTAV